MVRKRTSEPVSILTLVSGIGVIAALYFGREVAIPFTLAALLSFLLAPSVTWLEKAKVVRPAAVLIVLVIVFSAAGELIWVGVEQVSGMLLQLPDYQKNIQSRFERLSHPAGPATARAFSSLNALISELSSDNAVTHGSSPVVSRPRGGRGEPSPMPVKIVKEQPGVLQSLGLASTSIVHFLASAGAVVILSTFMLMRRTDLRDRFLRLFGRRRISVMTTAMDDAATRVSRYLVTQSGVNCIYGLSLGLGLYLLGVPYPVFWGVLACLLRFIPYAGTLIAGLCPFLLSLAVFPGWTKPFMTLGLFIAIEGLTAGFLEPWIYAKRTGTSSLAILVSAIFWTTLWGPIGLVLATPLTVCLAVLGRHLPQLEFMHILLGDEPVLAPEAMYYQRLLAGEEDEARELIDKSLKEKNLIELYDEILVPAVGMAQHDLEQNGLDEKQLQFILAATRDLVEDLWEEAQALPSLSKQATEKASSERILCIPARDEADALIALMVAQVLWSQGYEVNTASPGSLKEISEILGREKPVVLFISALPPFAMSRMRLLCRRAKKHSPQTKIVLGLWGARLEGSNLRERLGPECSEHVISLLSQTKGEMPGAQDVVRDETSAENFLPESERVASSPPAHNRSI